MSDGPLGVGQCVDQAVSGISALLYSTSSLYDVSQFINPQAAYVADLALNSQSAWDRAEAYRLVLESTFPPPPDLAALLLQVDNFQAAIVNFQLMNTRYGTWSEYCSGKSGGPFPFGNSDLAWMFPGGVPPGFMVAFPFLAGMGFASLLGTTSGGNKNAYVKCEVDPNDPCQGVKKILGAVLGIFNTVLNAMIEGFNLMVDFAAAILEYTTIVLGYIQSILAIIANAVAELVSSLHKAILDGMSRLFQGLTLDPCLSAVMGNVMSPALKTAVGVP